MDNPKIGFIWHISVARAQELGIEFQEDMTACMSTCKQYFNGSRSVNHRGQWQIGLELSDGTHLRVDEPYDGIAWERVRILMLNDQLGLPDESYTPPPPPITLKEMRARRLMLVVKEQYG